MPRAKATRRRRYVDVALVAAVVALFAVPLALRSGGSGDTSYGGTDSAAAKIVEEHGYRPWFSPLFRPASKEVESGLFALQAALGAGALGFALGRLSARRRASALGPASGPAPAPASGPASAPASGAPSAPAPPGEG